MGALPLSCPITFWGGGVERMPRSEGRVNRSYYMQGIILTFGEWDQIFNI